MSAGLSGAMKAGTPPINSIASTRAPIQSGIASDLRIAVGGSARIRFQIFFPRAVATRRPDGAAPDEFGHRRVQSVCGSDPRDVTVKYAQAYLRPVLAPWPNQAPMLMRALHTGRIAPTLILSARLIGRCDHPQAHFKQNTSFNLRMAIRWAGIPSTPKRRQVNACQTLTRNFIARQNSAAFSATGSLIPEMIEYRARFSDITDHL